MTDTALLKVLVDRVEKLDDRLAEHQKDNGTANLCIQQRITALRIDMAEGKTRARMVDRGIGIVVAALVSWVMISVVGGG